MRSKHLYTLISIVLICSCNSISNKVTEVDDSSSDTAILGSLVTEDSVDEVVKRDTVPQKLLKYISDSLYEYSIASLTDYMEGWEQATENKKLPYFTYSDFNGDESVDYAILLTKDSTIYVFAIHDTKQGFQPHIVKSFYFMPGKNQIVIHIEKKGIWRGMENEINVSNDGIGASWFNESRSSSYYWGGNSYIRF